MSLNESCMPFFLNLGYPVLLPVLSEWKKFLKARSKSRRDSCGAHLDTSYIQENSVFLSVFNYLCCSMALLDLFVSLYSLMRRASPQL